MVKLYYILAERLGLFAVRLPSLSRGIGLLGCGITFDILPMVYMVTFFVCLLITFTKKRKKRKKIHADDLDDGYNVVRSEMKK